MDIGYLNTKNIIPLELQIKCKSARLKCLINRYTLQLAAGIKPKQDCYKISLILRRDNYLMSDEDE